MPTDGLAATACLCYAAAMKAFLGILLGQLLGATEVISVRPMVAVKKFSFVLLLLIGFVASGWAQGQVNFANNSATRILLDPCMSSNNCTIIRLSMPRAP